MKKLFLVVLLFAVAVYGALSYHVIRMDQGLRFLKKARLTLEDTYVDARGAGKTKLFLRPLLVEAGIRDFLKEEGIRVGE